MKNGALLLKILFAFMVLTIIAGCSGTRLAKFYILEPNNEQLQRENQFPSIAFDTIVIGEVEIPDYLNRPQIVVRGDKNELHFLEYHRWAGSLKENIASVVAENLSYLLFNNNVFAYPFVPSQPAGCRIMISVVALDSVPGDHVEMKTLWTLMDGQNRRELVTKKSEFREKLTNKDYGLMIEAMNRMFGKLSREIASEIVKARIER